ncbi:MAG: hypothetical protein PHX08_26730 [Lachnospiraceae bacterium]|nr:hypothetical protein [Lachnospiraceae bacterium]
MNLINGDKLEEKIEEINSVDYGSMDSFEAHDAVRDCLSDIVRIIDKQPTINAVPVIHAHWIDYMPDKKDWVRNDGKSVFIECSKCHEIVIRNFNGSAKYCNNCGAIMDGREESNG